MKCNTSKSPLEGAVDREIVYKTVWLPCLKDLLMSSWAVTQRDAESLKEDGATSYSVDYF